MTNPPAESRQLAQAHHLFVRARALIGLGLALILQASVAQAETILATTIPSHTAPAVGWGQPGSLAATPAEGCALFNGPNTQAAPWHLQAGYMACYPATIPAYIDGQWVYNPCVPGVNCSAQMMINPVCPTDSNGVQGIVIDYMTGTCSYASTKQCPPNQGYILHYGYFPETNYNFGAVCKRPDCATGEVRNTNGVCGPPCEQGLTWSAATGGCACPL